MIESRQFSLIEVALMWGLPPSKLGASVGGGTYKNAEMEEVQARNDAVAPWTRLLEEAGSLELLPRGQHLEWDLSAALRTDTLSQYQAYQAALGGPGPTSQWQLVNEIRARENMDPMEIVEDQFNKQIEAAGVEVTPPAPPAIPTVAGGPEPTASQSPQANPPVQQPPAMPVNGKG
jgi:hypothetical protein